MVDVTRPLRVPEATPTLVSPSFQSESVAAASFPPYFSSPLSRLRRTTVYGLTVAPKTLDPPVVYLPPSLSADTKSSAAWNSVCLMPEKIS